MRTFYALFVAIVFSNLLVAQTTLYSEDFSQQDNKGYQGNWNQPNLNGVDWTIDISNANLNGNSAWFKVNGSMFTGKKINGTAAWLSPTIAIDGYINVAFSLSASSNGQFENDDVFQTYYRVDNGAWVLAETNGTLQYYYNNIEVSSTVNSGSTLQIKVEMTNNNSNEFMMFDNLNVVGQESSSHSCSATAGLLMERYDNIEGVSISSLTNSSNFPNNPSSTTILNTFEIPTNVADYYGARVSGYLTAPETGNYRFWIAGDDYAELWLSTDNNPNNKTRIAFHNGWTTSREWDKYSSQKSASINLTAGETYYIEALMKEHAGGDNLAVGWSKPGQAHNAPSEVIPVSVLSTASCDDNSQNVRTAELFFEDFEDENNNATDGEDAYGTFWAAETFGEDPERFQVRSNNGNRYFESDAARGEETWLTEPIAITNFEDLKLSASIDFFDLENNDEEDFIEISYQIDGGDIVEVATLQGSGTDGTYTWNLTGVTGNTIELLIRFSSDHRDEGHRIDNIMLSAVDMNPRVYVYENETWSPNDPSGESIMVDEIIIRSGNTTLNTNTEANTITVKPGAGLSIPNGVTVTLAEQMTLESASDSYSSLILDGVIEGTVNYERYVNTLGTGNTGDNDLITAPLNGQRFEDFANTNIDELPSNNNLRFFGPFNNSSNAFEFYNVIKQ